MVQTAVEVLDTRQGDDGLRVMVESLQKLQDQARPLPFEQIQTILNDNFGRPMDQVFVDFQEAPFASGSIGQAHRAKIRRGDELVDVVVKVRKPGVQEALHHNFNILRFALKVLGALSADAFERSGARKWIAEHVPDGIAADQLETRDVFAVLDGLTVNLERSFEREGDFVAEADNLERFGRMLRTNAVIRVPKVFREYSAEGVITMEVVEATPLHKLLARDPKRERHDYLQLKTELIQTYIVQTFLNRFLHGDFHGGNTGIDEKGKIVLYDLGQMVDLRGKLGSPIGLLVNAFTNDAPGVTRALLNMCDVVSGKTVDKAAFQSEVKAVLSRCHREGQQLLRSRAILEALSGALSWSVRDAMLAHLPATTRETWHALSDAMTTAIERSVRTLSSDDAKTLSIDALADRLTDAATGALLEKERQAATNPLRATIREAMRGALDRREEDVIIALGAHLGAKDGKKPNLIDGLRNAYNDTMRAATERATAVALAIPQLLVQGVARHDLNLSAEYFQLLKTNLSFWATVLRLREVHSDLAVGGKVRWKNAPFDVTALLRGLLLREPKELIARSVEDLGKATIQAATSGTRGRSLHSADAVLSLSRDSSPSVKPRAERSGIRGEGASSGARGQ